MKWIRERALKREVLSGTFLNLGSSVTAEIAGQAGFDWVLVDLEHGAGNRSELLVQLQAIESTPAVPLVRIPWNDPVMVKRVLDLGVSGVMFPYVQTAEEARKAVAAMRYPPDGIRGVAAMNRATGFGPGFDDYFKIANSRLLTLIQIETPATLENLDDIAAIDGVDVLFLGPMDMSVGFGVVGQWSHPRMQAARKKIVTTCQMHGKAAGVLAGNEEQIAQSLAEGFTFVGSSSDSAAVMKGLQAIAASIRKHSNPK